MENLQAVYGEDLSPTLKDDVADLVADLTDDLPLCAAQRPLDLQDAEKKIVQIIQERGLDNLSNHKVPCLLFGLTAEG